MFLRNGKTITGILSKGLVPAVCARTSSDAAGVRTETIGSSLSFRSIENNNDNDRPLVVLFSWLLAKSTHISKYGDFYLDKGYDVLTLKVEPMQLLWPKRAQKVVQNALDFIEQEKNKTTVNPLLIHGFSVGGYLYGEFLVKLKQAEDRYQEISQSIRGQILDSPVDIHGVPRGVSKAVTPNPVLRQTIKSTLDSYMWLSKKQVGRHYQHSQDTFIDNYLKTPSMFLYSKADPIGDYTIIDEIISKFMAEGIEVHSKCWDDTPHVSHMYHHPSEYLDMLNTFLEHIDLQKPQDHRAKHTQAQDS